MVEGLTVRYISNLKEFRKSRTNFPDFTYLVAPPFPDSFIFEWSCLTVSFPAGEKKISLKKIARLTSLPEHFTKPPWALVGEGPTEPV